MLIKKDPDTIKSYLEDSSNIKGGHAEEVAFPEDVSELSALLKAANSAKTAVTVSGGGTSTTGSRVPFGGIVVSLERLNRIFDVSQETMSADVQAGVLVEDLKCACEKKALFYTSHPTEKTASVGGTVATNASGARSFKYGPTRRYVKRLKMVLADGEILDLRRGALTLGRSLCSLRLASGREIEVPIPTYRMPDVKNAAGYFAKDGMDLIDLFIGQEGTLSVITDVEMGLVRKPQALFSCFVFFEKEEDAWGFCSETAGALSVEYFDSNSLKLLAQKNPNIPRGSNAAIFFEEETAAEKKDALAALWLERMSRHNVSVDNTWVAMNEKEVQNFESFRYAIPDMVNDIIRGSGFPKLGTDIAVPAGKFLEMMRFYVSTFEVERLEHVIFGHIGENHVHVNMLPRSQVEAAKGKELVLAFVRKAVSLGGTVSAEHGIGKIKHKYLEEMYGRSGILEMARIKKAFDPNCILSPGNIFPREVFDAV